MSIDSYTGTDLSEKSQEICCSSASGHHPSCNNYKINNFMSENNNKSKCCEECKHYAGGCIDPFCVCHSLAPKSEELEVKQGYLGELADDHIQLYVSTREKIARGAEDFANRFEGVMKELAEEEKCVGCGKTYREHQDNRPIDAPVPKCMCLLLKSNFIPRIKNKPEEESKEKEGWEIEYEKVFLTYLHPDDHPKTFELVKAFIHQSHQDLKDELVRDVERMDSELLTQSNGYRIKEEFISLIKQGNK